MKKLKNEQGITLVALIITIIVLLILALVAINAIQGENSIISKANYAGTKYTQEGENENAMIGNYVDYMYNTIGGNNIIVDNVDNNILKENVVYASSESNNEIQCFISSNGYYYVLVYNKTLGAYSGNPLKVTKDYYTTNIDVVEVSNNGNTVFTNNITFNYDSSLSAIEAIAFVDSK